LNNNNAIAGNDKIASEEVLEKHSKNKTINKDLTKAKDNDDSTNDHLNENVKKTSDNNKDAIDIKRRKAEALEDIRQKRNRKIFSEEVAEKQLKKKTYHKDLTITKDNEHDSNITDSNTNRVDTSNIIKHNNNKIINYKKDWREDDEEDQYENDPNKVKVRNMVLVVSKKLSSDPQGISVKGITDVMDGHQLPESGTDDNNFKLHENIDPKMKKVEQNADTSTATTHDGQNADNTQVSDHKGSNPFDDLIIKYFARNEVLSDEFDQEILEEIRNSNQPLDIERLKTLIENGIFFSKDMTEEQKASVKGSVLKHIISIINQVKTNPKTDTMITSNNKEVENLTLQNNNITKNTEHMDHDNNNNNEDINKTNHSKAINVDLKTPSAKKRVGSREINSIMNVSMNINNTNSEARQLRKKFEDEQINKRKSKLFECKKMFF
jgi:hypothetical protein